MRTYVHPYFRLSIRNPQPHPQGFVSFGAYLDPNSTKQPKFKQFSPNLSIMAQIQALRPKSKQNGSNQCKMAQIQAKWPNSWQLGSNPGEIGLIWLKNLNFGLNSVILAPQM